MWKSTIWCESLAADTTPAAVGGSPQKALQEIIQYSKWWLKADLNTCLLNYNLLQLYGIGKQLAKVFFYIWPVFVMAFSLNGNSIRANLCYWKCDSWNFV